MEYERIHNPSPQVRNLIFLSLFQFMMICSSIGYDLASDLGLQGGGLSPAKLRAMLLGGADKRKKEEDEIESRFYFRSNSGSEIESRRKKIEVLCFSLTKILMELGLKVWVFDRGKHVG